MNYVVVKFHDKEKYAAVVCGGDKHECEVKRACFKGITHETPWIDFGIYEESHYDMCVQLEQMGQGELYTLLQTTNCVTMLSR